jgi:hypothetical protein
VKNKWIPWVVAAVFGVWILSTLRTPRDKGWAISEFGKLPLLSNGRFQPMDSLARNSLLQLREKQSMRLQDEGRQMPATEWLMETMMHQQKADQRKVFRVDHPEVKSLLKLPEKNADGSEDGKHYSWNQIKPGLEQLEKEGQRVAALDAAHRNSFDQGVMKLQNALFLYMRLKSTIHRKTRPISSRIWSNTPLPWVPASKHSKQGRKAKSTMRRPSNSSVILRKSST